MKCNIIQNQSKSELLSILKRKPLLINYVIALQTEVKKAQPREVMQSLQGGRGRASRTLAGRGFCKYNGNQCGDQFDCLQYFLV